MTKQSASAFSPLRPAMPTSSTAPTSRRERERLMRRTAILAAAREVFAEHGYEKATIDEIAERAEFGKGTLYNYFQDGKEGILFAVLDELYDEIVALMQEQFDPEAPTATALRASFRQMAIAGFEYYIERRALFFIVVKECNRMLFSDDPERSQYLMGQYRRMVDVLMPVLEEAKAAGAIRDVPTEAIAHTLLGNLDGLMVHLTLETRWEDKAPTDLMTAAEAADFLTTLLFDGLLQSSHT